MDGSIKAKTTTLHSPNRSQQIEKQPTNNKKYKYSFKFDKRLINQKFNQNEKSNQIKSVVYPNDDVNVEL